MAPAYVLRLAPRHATRSLRPRAYQLRCRRFVSSEPQKDKADWEPIAPARPTPDPRIQGVRDPHELLLEIQQRQREAQKRRLEGPKREASSGEENESFHPLFVGFVWGAGMAFAVSVFIYYFSGNWYVSKASAMADKSLKEEQKRIALGEEKSNLTAEEIAYWLRRISYYYSAFYPQSEAWIAARDREIQKGMAQGPAKVKELRGIAEDCAKELQERTQANSWASHPLLTAFTGLGNGKQGWNVIMKHLLRVEEAVEGKEVVARRRERAKRGIYDEVD